MSDELYAILKDVQKFVKEKYPDFHGSMVIMDKHIDFPIEIVEQKLRAVGLLE
jgi:hypothetical protein